MIHFEWNFFNPFTSHTHIEITFKLLELFLFGGQDVKKDSRYILRSKDFLLKEFLNTTSRKESHV